MKRRGFTLIEVIVALTIGAFLVLAMHQVWGATTDAANQLIAARAAHEPRMITRDRLRSLFGSIEVNATSAAGFAGSPDHCGFRAFPDRQVQVQVDGGWLAVRIDSIVERLMPAQSLQLDYLMQTGADERWVRSWESTSSAPLAVRVRIYQSDEADTLLIVVGSRG